MSAGTVSSQRRYLELFDVDFDCKKTNKRNKKKQNKKTKQTNKETKLKLADATSIAQYARIMADDSLALAVLNFSNASIISLPISQVLAYTTKNARWVSGSKQRHRNC